MVTFAEQAEVWLKDLQARKRKPLSPNSLRTFKGHINRLNPIIGAKKLDEISNGVLKQLAQRLYEEQLSPKTIVESVSTVKSIVASLVDQETAEPVLKREWSANFIDCPTISAETQKRPRMTSQDVQNCINSACTDQEKVFYALLAGSGLRVAEAQALHFQGEGKHTSWDRESSTITVRSIIFNHDEINRVKTPAAKRIVELHPSLNDLLAEFVEANGIAPGNYVFQSRDANTPMYIGTMRRRLNKHGVKGFHCFRRFYVSIRRSLGFPDPLLRAMIGHSSKSITDDYDQSAEDAAYRKQWTLRAGLGFQLPELRKSGDPGPQTHVTHAAQAQPVTVTTEPVRYIATDDDLPAELFEAPAESLAEVE